MPDCQGIRAVKFLGMYAQPNAMDTKREARRQDAAWKQRIGSAVRDWRDKRHMTQAQLAKAVGVDIATIGKTELGKTVPDYATLETIADILAVTLDALVGRDSEWTKPQGDAAGEMGARSAEVLALVPAHQLQIEMLVSALVHAKIPLPQELSTLARRKQRKR